MMTHRVSEFFGNIIEIEALNTDIKEVSATHYGDLPWSKTDPQFATVEEKWLVYKDGRSARRTEEKPAFCTHSKFKRFFVIKKFKAVTAPTTDDKPQRRGER